MFCSSLRYSIYKVQFASRSRGQLLHTSTPSSVCQELFSTFSKFLQALYSVRCRDSWDILAQTSLFVKNYFSFREIIFLFTAARGQLAYTSTRIRFCQALFLIFFVSGVELFVSCFLMLQPRSEQCFSSKRQVWDAHTFKSQQVEKKHGSRSCHAPQPRCPCSQGDRESP